MIATLLSPKLVQIRRVEMVTMMLGVRDELNDGRRVHQCCLSKSCRVSRFYLHLSVMTVDVFCAGVMIWIFCTFVIYPKLHSALVSHLRGLSSTIMVNEYTRQYKYIWLLKCMILWFPSMFGHRVYSVASLVAWNLPDCLWGLSRSFDSFRQGLKTSLILFY